LFDGFIVGDINFIKNILILIKIPLIEQATVLMLFIGKWLHALDFANNFWNEDGISNDFMSAYGNPG
jgi:hypothetical protein